MAIVWAIGVGIGLAALAGLRPIIPLAVFILFARLGWAWGFKVQGTPMDWFHSVAAVAVLLALIILEIILTRTNRSLARVDTRLQLPLAIIIGALVFVATLSGEFSSNWRWLALAAGVVLALLGTYVHTGLAITGGGKDPGPALDFTVVILSVLMMLVPPAGYLLLLLVLWLALRVRRLKRMKYKGLRVLA